MGSDGNESNDDQAVEAVAEEMDMAEQSGMDMPVSEPDENNDSVGVEIAESVETDESEEGEKAEVKPVNPNFEWYVVQAYSMYEKKVQRSMIEAIERNGLEQFFGDILVPTEEVVEMRAGQKRTSERKFFPGYVLVQMEVNDASWHLVNSMPKTSGFVGGKQGAPTPLSKRESDAILQRMSDSVDTPQPRFVFSPGEMVRVIDGPFADFSGTVEDVNFEKSRLHVSVMIFGRSTPVELGFDQVEKG